MSNATINSNSKAGHGVARNFVNPTTREGARLTVNLDTGVVVLRYGSWGDDALVTRTHTMDEAREAWAKYQQRALRDGFKPTETEHRNVHFSVEAFKARVRGEQCGFLTEKDLQCLARYARLEQVLIRWHEGRAVVAAQDAAGLIRNSKWTLRDVSLPAGQ